ncbi:hypothetical protein R1sor_019154 [Riccia sorocarpa]|uniref:NB-ARC domain-containing protein n=1 Tax=Riccia sorocarpa TaxID=122646 RepID=A0ABD3IBV8_9MARC
MEATRSDNGAKKQKGRKRLASFWSRKLRMLVKWISGPAESDHSSDHDDERLNDSLYSWYEPNDPELEIVFFHGLVPTACGDIHRKAWTNGFGECWPEKWLQDEQGFPRARILSVKYDSSLKKTKSAGVYALKLLSETLATDLIDLGNIGQTDISEERRHQFERFLNNVRGVFYFSTPHHGLFSSISEFNGERAKCLRIFSRQTARLNEDFWKLRESRKWRTAGVGSVVEDTEVKRKGSGFFPEATNRCDTDNFLPLLEPRESINKPCSRISSSFQFFVDSVKDFIQCHRVEDVDERFQDFIRENVGLEKSVEEVISCLARLETAEGGINPVVLHGMGGIGKSTLGDAVFLKLSKKFDPDCRLWLDREANRISTPSITDLQLSIIKRLSYVYGSESMSGSKQIREKLLECYKEVGRPLLIFIDNIENEEELEEILPGNINDLLPGSYIVIASRNLRMCTRLRKLCRPYPHPDFSRLYRVAKVCSYQVKALDEHSAEKLFWQSAVMQQLSESRILQMQKDVQKVLHVCGGLPLALKVVGAALAATSLSNWSDVLQRLEDSIPVVDGTREDSLNRSLQFSYSQLQDNIQQAFLDIVFCFDGSPWNQLKVMYGDKLNILEQRALIMKEEREEYGRSFSHPTVKVHALFVALGRREGKASGSHISVEGERNLRLQDIDLKTGKDVSIVLVLQGNLPRFGYGDDQTRCLEPITKKKTRRQGVLPSCKWESLRILVLRDLLIQETFRFDEVPENLECLICTNSNLPFPRGNLTSLRNLKYLDILTRVDDQHSYMFPGGVQYLRLENTTLKEFTFGSKHSGSASQALKEFGLMSTANLVVNIRIGQLQSLSKLVLTNI